MGLFKIKKKEEPPVAPVPEAPSGLPVDQVNVMRQQGYTDNQIIQALQTDGFTSQQVFDAMKQSDLSTAVGAPIPQGQPPAGYPPQEIAPPGADPAGMPPPQEMPPMGDLPPPPAGMPPLPGAQKDISEEIEQIAEAIIDEKWEEFAKKINKLIEWKDGAEKRFEDMQNQMQRMQTDFDKLHTSILGKIGEYDQNILNVGTEIKAMEKVFQKILPSLTDNVAQLQKLTTDLKKKKQ